MTVLFVIESSKTYWIWKASFLCFKQALWGQSLWKIYLSKSNLWIIWYWLWTVKRCSYNMYFPNCWSQMSEDSLLNNRRSYTKNFHHPQIRMLFCMLFHAKVDQPLDTPQNNKTSPHKDTWLLEVSFWYIIHNNPRVNRGFMPDKFYYFQPTKLNCNNFSRISRDQGFNTFI